MSTIYVDNLQPNLSSNVNIPGHIIQVKQSVKTNAFAGALGAQWADISDLSVSITPISSTSKILVMVDLKGAGAANASVVRSRIVRDSTPIYIGDAASNRPRGMSQFYGGPDTGNDIFYMAQLGGSYLDSPNTTSAVTYKVQLGGDNNSLTLYVNRTQGDRDGSYFDTRVASSITVMEIAG